MQWFDRASRFKDALRGSAIVRLVGVFTSGSLGQRAVATLGIASMAYGVFKSLVWVVLIVAGMMLCYFAVEDYERMRRP